MTLNDAKLYPDELSKAKLSKLTERVNERYEEIPSLTRDRSSVHGLYQLGNNVDMHKMEINELVKQNLLQEKNIIVQEKKIISHEKKFLVQELKIDS